MTIEQLNRKIDLLKKVRDKVFDAGQEEFAMFVHEQRNKIIKARRLAERNQFISELQNRVSHAS